MNIIILEDYNIRVTQQSTDYMDINTLRFFVKKDSSGGGLYTLSNLNLSFVEKIDFNGELIDGLTLNYSIGIECNEDLETSNYIGYSINSMTAFPAKEYQCSLKFSDSTEITLAPLKLYNNYAADEHGALRVNERTIDVSHNTNTLVAEDNLSQVITFLIKEKYDGISFLDDTKKVCVEYVPVGYVPAEGYKDFYSDEISVKYYAADVEEEERWMYLKWKVPRAATYYAGQMPFAISVTDNEGYVWQTIPAYLTILPNIGRRNGTAPEAPSEDYSTLESRVVALEEFSGDIDNVSNISESGQIEYTIREDRETEKHTYELGDLLAANLNLDYDESGEYLLIGGGTSSSEEA